MVSLQIEVLPLTMNSRPMADSKHQENASAQHEDPHAKKNQLRATSMPKRSSSHGEKQVEAKRVTKKWMPQRPRALMARKNQLTMKILTLKGAKTAAEGHQSKEHHEKLPQLLRGCQRSSASKDLPKT